MDNKARNTDQENSEVPLHELLDSHNVDIIVGPESTRWSLPEKLLCHHSKVLQSEFKSDDNEETSDSEARPSSGNKSKNKSYTLSDEENATFKMLIAYFYSDSIPPVSSEKNVGPLLDLYLLALRLEIDALATKVVDTVREWYHTSSTYPGLRRVQYIYANTDDDNEMREMMVSSVARQLTTGEVIAAHWAKALQRNGQLAVDIIRAIQQWHIEEASIPDVRDGSIGRDRKMKGGFSAVEREENSTDTLADSAIGLASDDGEVGEQAKGEIDAHVDAMKEVANEAYSLTPIALNLLQAHLIRPPDRLSSPQNQMTRRRRNSVTFAPVANVVEIATYVSGEDEEDHRINDNDRNDMTFQSISKPLEISVPTKQDESHNSTAAAVTRGRESPQSSGRLVGACTYLVARREVVLLIILWIAYLLYMMNYYPLTGSAGGEILKTSLPVLDWAQLRHFRYNDWAR